MGLHFNCLYYRYPKKTPITNKYLCSRHLIIKKLKLSTLLGFLIEKELKPFSETIFQNVADT